MWLELIVAGIAAVFFGAVRPWYRRWDATDQETRAITIDAPVEQVWPWLAQLGQDLGGIGHAVLAAYVPGRALGFATRTPGRALSEPPDGSWSFVLEPLDARTTRLLVRGRGPRQLSLLGAAFQVLTLAQPTPAIGAGLLAGAALLLREPASAGPASADL